MCKQYQVLLSDTERSELDKLIKKGKVAANKGLHAEILRKADVGESGPGWTDAKISEAIHVGLSTIERTRQRLGEEGLEIAIAGPPSTQIYRRKLDGDGDAHLIALACSTPPTVIPSGLYGC